MTSVNGSNNEIPEIDISKLKLVERTEKIFDAPPCTEAESSLRAAVRRFGKSRSAVASLIVIGLLILYAILWPIFSEIKVSDRNEYYRYSLPKLSTKFDIGFWNGCKTEEVIAQKYDYYEAIPGAIKKVYSIQDEEFGDGIKKIYKLSVDKYAAVGFVEMNLTKAALEEIKNYEKSTGKTVLYPVIDINKVNCMSYRANANAWFLTDNKGRAVRDSEGKLQNIFLTQSADNKDDYVIDGYVYGKALAHGKQYQVRVLYSEYYFYENGREACYLFGSDEMGYDICVRLASGARISLSISFAVAIITLLIGIVVGCLEGYYGGNTDLIIEAIKEIISQIPTIVLITVFQLYIGSKMGAMFSLFICFIIFGWIGISSTVRAQFYRFKGQEYVLAARTLGARDRRIIFRHILPNASGFIITSCILTIPGVIFGEATFSYLGIVNLNTDKMTSVGTMLQNGQAAMAYYPHCVLLPALFLGILLICFNELGNGLRDAFNPVSD